MVAGLIGTVSENKNGLYDKTYFPYRIDGLAGHNFLKLFTLPQYAYVNIIISIGPVHISNNLAMAILQINNRNQSSLSVVTNVVANLRMESIYAKRNPDSSADIFLKIPDEQYIACNYQILGKSNHSITIANIFYDSDGDELTEIQV